MTAGTQLGPTPPLRGATNERITYLKEVLHKLTELEHDRLPRPRVSLGLQALEQLGCDATPADNTETPPPRAQGRRVGGVVGWWVGGRAVGWADGWSGAWVSGSMGGWVGCCAGGQEDGAGASINEPGLTERREKAALPAPRPRQRGLYQQWRRM